MTDPSGFGAGARLTFHGPLSAARANRLAADLAASGPASVVEYGCGWGEFLLRVLETAPGASGTGIDISGRDIARARENAERRGLSGRVSFVEGPATDHAGQVRAKLDAHRSIWLRGHRDALGFAYLTLGVPSP